MAGEPYKLQVWGARGTGPTPSADRLQFGGHTSCLAVEISDREYLILDCGSGLRMLGHQLAGQRDGSPHRFHIFLSHYHLDHIEGLPLFPPLYDERSVISIYGFHPEGRTLRDLLEAYISPPYFPVSLAEVPSKIDYRDVDRAPYEVGDLTVTSLPVNHPGGCRSFRLDHGGKSIVYATDHEHGNTAIDDELLEFARGADFLIYDATYQPAEYEELRKGWGHSTWYAAVQTALNAEIGTLVLFHHHLDHTDEELNRVLAIARQEFPSTVVAREGLELPF